jgi:hypothetical protein
MKFPISPHMQQVPFPPISEVQRWLAEHLYIDAEPLIDLCQAVPDYGPGLKGYLRIAFGTLSESQIPEAVTCLRELPLD